MFSVSSLKVYELVMLISGFYHLPLMQAYRNHQLYAIERWLNKYQILHPKGPVLGFCSGHPVYPRTSVQTLKTKERWMQEALQVKANELPAKVWS